MTLAEFFRSRMEKAEKVRKELQAHPSDPSPELSTVYVAFHWLNEQLDPRTKKDIPARKTILQNVLKTGEKYKLFTDIEGDEELKRQLAEFANGKYTAR